MKIDVVIVHVVADMEQAVLPELFCQNAPLPENRLFCASPEIAFDKKSKKRLFCAKKKKP